MKLKANKKSLTSKFLGPVSRLTDRCVVNIQKDNIYTLTNDENATIILYSVFKTKNTLDKGQKSVSLNIPDIKRLNRVFNCIESDNIELEIGTNSLTYDSNGLKFKYHLLDDDIIAKNVVSIDKIKSLTFDTEFTLTFDKLVEILKGTAFVNEANKLYFNTVGKKVYAEVTDKKIQNTDSITFAIANSFTGSKVDVALPINLDIFRLAAGIKKDIKVKINTKVKVLMFDICESDFRLKYILSALVS